MKVLQILPELRVGGVETGTVDLARYLIDHGHEAVVVSNGGSLVKDLEDCGARHYKLPVDKKSVFTAIKCIKKLKEIILKENADIVHARSRVPAWIAFFACRHTNASFITTCHGYYSLHFLSRVMSWPKIIIVPSDVIGRHMIDDFGVSSENIRKIPRSVDLAKFKNIPRQKEKGKSEIIVAIVGRITPLKGHIYFIKAMAKVLRSIPYLRIWIIGDAPAKKEGYKEQLQVLIRRLGLEDFVDFLGNRRDVPCLLSMVDVLVLSTITQEAFGRVILEAQAAGVPVVATKVGGVIEIIEDKKTGLLVTPKDSDSMAKSIVALIKDKALSNSLTSEARKKLEANFTLEHMASQTIKVYEELLKSERILVSKISSLGDVVLVTASLKAIREKFPHASIYCLVGKESRQILHRCPYIDGLIVIDSKHKDKGFWGLLKLSKKLRKYKFDKFIDLQNNRKSHFLGFLSFPKESYGYDNGKFSFLLSKRIKDKDKRISAVEHQFKVLNMLGIDYTKDAYLELWPSEKDDEYIQNILDSEWMASNKKIVGINISASEKWKSKNWPVEHIVKLCDTLSSKNIRTILTGTEQDSITAERIMNEAKSKPTNLTGKTTILQLAALIKRCSVFVTPDSAPMHVAAAVETPFVGLFGPTESVRHIPPSNKYTIIEKSPPCAPCYNPICEIVKHDCMKDISSAEVAAEIEKLMSKK